MIWTIEGPETTVLAAMELGNLHGAAGGGRWGIALGICLLLAAGQPSAADPTGAPPSPLPTVMTTELELLYECLDDGTVAFINDANAHNDWFEPTRLRRGISKGKDIDWDTNPAAHGSAPPNGWVHPFVFYNCTFGGTRHTFLLLNVDPAKGEVLQTVDLAPLAK